jgi:hypothetical protein
MSVVPIASDRSHAAYAQAYIALGWSVLPLDPGTKKPLGRLVPNGFHDATADTDTAARWWAANPDAGIGVALKASGLVAVDIDPRNGGLFTMERLEAEHGPLVSDVLAYTGGGGEHRVFASQLVEGLPGKLGDGVDLKADGYIAVEPTLHPSGRRYAWEAESDPLHGAVPSTLPGWIRDLARRPLAATLPAAPARSIDARRLADARDALPHIECESRDSWLRVGMAIHNEMPGPDGFDLWTAWSQRSAKFDAQDQLRVWRSFKSRGLSGVGLNTVFAMAQGSGWRNVGNVVVLPTPAADGMLLDVVTLDARSAATRWAVKGMVPDASLGMIFGASGTFKSFVALDYQLHRAWAMAWCGRRTVAGVPIFVAAEGGTGLIRRIKAWHLARGLDWRECRLLVVVVPLLLMRQAQALAEAIAAQGVQPCDIVIDTLSQTFDGNENAADEVASYLRALRVHLVDRFACSVTVVHHSGHGATERPRGSSAIMANVDYLFGVFRQGDESMTTTVECLKVKDGEKFKPVDFVLESFQVGTDEDGEAVTSLAARYVNNAEAVLKADDRKREGHRALLLRLAGALIDERETRKAFDAELADTPDGTRRAAWKRAVDWAVDNGMLRRINGRFEVVRNVAEVVE